MTGMNVDKCKSISFSECTNLLSVNLNRCNFTNLSNLRTAFRNCAKLKTLVIDNVTDWRVTDFANTFRGAGIDDLFFDNIIHWNYKSAISLESMFAETTNLRAINIENLDMPNCNTLVNMFYNSSIENVTINNFHSYNAYAKFLFASCARLKNVKMQNCDFYNEPQYGVSSNLFGDWGLTGLSKNTTKDIMLIDSKFSKISNIGSIYFGHDSPNNLRSVYISNCTGGMEGNGIFVNNSMMFYNMPFIENIELHDLNLYNVSYFMRETQAKNVVLNNINFINSKLDYMWFRQGWSTRYTDMNVTYSNIVFSDTLNIKYGFINQSQGFNHVEFSDINFTTAPVIENLFGEVSGEYLNMANINLSLINNIFNFGYWVNFKEIRLTNWDLSNCTDLTDCFGAQNSDYSNVFIENWDISNVTALTSMFAYQNNLSDATIDSVINLCLNAPAVIYRNLDATNEYSPFYKTNIVNTRYQNRWSDLTNAGWSY